MKRKPTLITLAAFALLFLSISWLDCTFAQEGWSLPVQITEDANYNYRNVDLIEEGSNWPTDIWVAYEKYSDSVSTAICIQEILNTGQTIEILSEDSVHFLNPHFFLYNYFVTDTLFFLFYETIQNGQKDLHYLKYLNTGEILGPFPFFPTLANDHYIDMSLHDNQVAWVNNGKLMVSWFVTSPNNYGFSEPIVVDSGNCISPKNIEWSGDIYYINRMNSSSVLYHAVNMGEYFTIEIVYDDGYAKNLKKDGLGTPLVSWTGKDNADSLWRMYTFLDYSSGEYSSHFIAKETPYDPGICSFVLGVKSTTDWSEYFLAFPYDSLGYEELYMNLDPFDPNYSNFTNLQSTCQNPNSFYGEPGENSCFYAYFVWETLVNGKWQLFYSKTLECIGSVDENESYNSFIK